MSNCLGEGRVEPASSKTVVKTTEGGKSNGFNGQWVVNV
jgi:hypothetical protein